MIAYRSDYGKPAPVQVEVQSLEYGQRDSEGQTVYSNRHFATLDEAWKQHLTEHHAAEDLAQSRLREAERELERARTEVVNAARFGFAAREAFNERERQRRGES